MAKPTTMRWTKLSIWPSDGGSPEDFQPHVCGFNAKSFSINGQTSDAIVPDCDDPDAPAWVERVMRSLSGSFSGAGLLAEENDDFYTAWALSGESKTVRIVVDKSGTPKYFEGNYLLTKYEITGNESDGKVQVSMSFDSDGEITVTNGAP